MHPAIRSATGVAGLAAMTMGGPARALDWEFADGGKLAFYGLINIAGLFYDDGRAQYDYVPVGNSNAPSRAGLLWASANEAWGARFEFQYQPRPSSAVSQRDADVTDWAIARTDLRKLELYWRPDFGAFALGQGSMASDGIAEIDLSGTTVVAYSSVSDPAGGNFFRFGDGTLSEVTIGATLSDFDGSRRMRIRYDTRRWNGLQLAASYGREVLREGDDSDYADVALRYDGKTDRWTYSAGAGYNWKIDEGSTASFWAASGSILDSDTGLNATLALGANDADARYWYAKLGLKRDFWSFGSTALSVDHYDGAGFVARGSATTSWGIAAVQRIDRADLELYAVWRSYGFDETAASYRTGHAVMTGFRWTW
jgi:hypothetical protein